MANVAGAMKARLREDLKAAMRDKRMDEAKLIRTLVAAIDQAEAQALPEGSRSADSVDFLSGAAEVARRDVSAADVRAAILGEIEEREQAAEELEKVGMSDKADELRVEAQLARRYVQ